MKIKRKVLVSAMMLGFATSGALAFKPNKDEYGHQRILKTLLSSGGYSFGSMPTTTMKVPQYLVGGIPFSDAAMREIVDGGNSRDWSAAADIPGENQIIKQDNTGTDQVDCYARELHLFSNYSNTCTYRNGIYITGDLYRWDAHFDDDGFTKSTDAIYQLIRGNPDWENFRYYKNYYSGNQVVEINITHAGVGVIDLLKKYVTEVGPNATSITQEQKNILTVARIKLGKALHTLHDFYAHSTWADAHLTQKDSLFLPITDNLLNSSSNPDFSMFALVAGENGKDDRKDIDACFARAYKDSDPTKNPTWEGNGGNWDLTLPALNGIISTGAFDTALSGGKSTQGDGYAADGPVGKVRCDHGNYPLLGYANDRVSGISKDAPGWPLTNTEPAENATAAHLVASYQAAKHSAILLDKVVEIIRTDATITPADAERMIAALLGSDRLPQRLVLVVDATGSMGHIIPGIDEAIGSAASVSGMTLVTFNEAGVLSTAHDDSAKMRDLLKQAGKGGTSCKVPAYTALKQVLNELPDGSTVYWITDASASDAYQFDLLVNDASKFNVLVNSAKIQEIKINTIALGECSNAPAVSGALSYEALGKATGGRVIRTLPDKSPVKNVVASLLMSETAISRAKSAPSLSVAKAQAATRTGLVSAPGSAVITEIGTINTTQTVNIPVDGGLGQVLVTVAATGAQTSLVNAAGQPVALTNSGNGLLFAVVNNPAPGAWKLVMKAATPTPYQVQVEAQGGVTVRSLDYAALLEVGPRSGHEYAPMLGSTPPSGASKASLGIEGVTGDTLTLNYVREDGSLIASYPLTRASSVAFAGKVTVPASAYWVRIAGTSERGGNFVRMWRGEHALPTPMPGGRIVAIAVPDAKWQPGKTGTASVSLSNVGADEVITLSASSSLGTVTVTPSTLTLPANTASLVKLSVNVPANATAADLVLLLRDSTGVREITVPVALLATAPTILTIPPATNATRGGSVVSDPITVSGTTSPVIINVTNGEYRVNGGAWTAATGTVKNGDVVNVRVTASTTAGATVLATLSIGNSSGSFSVTTANIALDDGTVTDPNTGLTWKRCMEGQTWSYGTCTGTFATYTFDQANALTGKVTFAGQSDWRMPNIRELTTIVDYTKVNPAIDLNVFPNTAASGVWSGSPLAVDASNVWVVNFSDGGAHYNGRNYSSGVRLVRGGQQSFEPLNGLERPDTDYVNHGDGTTTHTPTGLMWQRCMLGQTWLGSTCTGTASKLRWDAAKAITSNFAGKADWRLPTERELLSLVDYTTTEFHSPINAGLFPNDAAADVWSDSRYASDAGFAWVVYFNFGGSTNGNRRDDFGVRLVRGGQPLAALPPTDINCFLNWAEALVPDLLTPANGAAKRLDSISYRAYSNGLYAGVQGGSGTVLAVGGALGPLVQKVGNLADFLPAARAASCKK